MPNLEVWRCGNCGGNVPIGDASRPVSYCGFCGAALVSPAAASHEPASYDVRLEHAGASPIPVMKVLAELTTLRVGRDLLAKIPCVVLSGASLDRAEHLRQKLAGAGASALVIQRGGSAAPALACTGVAGARPAVGAGQFVATPGCATGPAADTVTSAVVTLGNPALGAATTGPTTPGGNASGAGAG